MRRGRGDARPAPARRRRGLSATDAVVAVLALGVLTARAASWLRGEALRHGVDVSTLAMAASALGLAVAAALLAARLRSGRPSARTPSLLRTAGRGLPGFATGRQLDGLLTGADTGDRIVVGTLGRRLVAAERLQSVLVVGPSQSGKTTSLAVPALAGWRGPVLATSVKTDLLASTAGIRSGAGEVAVFDPVGCSGRKSAGWSPLGAAASWPGARRVAASLCSLGRRDGGIEDAGYWYASAERLLAPLLLAASLSGSSMAEVVAWAEEEELDQPVYLLDQACQPNAARVVRSFLLLEERQRSSVVSTLRTVVDCYGDPAVAASEWGSPRISGSWLLDGEAGGAARTLYCCAPAREQARLAPVFVALVQQVVDAAFERASLSGRPLDPPLLLVLDEVANIAPLPDLDQLLATGAGHGVQVLTVWQDLAQSEARYGARWATIVNNHRAKVICPGVSDPRTLELVSALVGDVETVQLSTSSGPGGSSSRTESPWRVPVAPPGWIRRLPERHALVVYGRLPPALVRLREPLGTGRKRRASRSARP